MQERNELTPAQRRAVESNLVDPRPPRPNVSDPLVWAAKLNLERKLTERGRQAAIDYRMLERVKEQLDRIPSEWWNYLNEWLWKQLYALGRAFRLTDKELHPHTAMRMGLNASKEHYMRVLGEAFVEDMERAQARHEAVVSSAPAKRPVNYGERNRGFEAGRICMTASDNPHATGTIEHYSWEKGRRQGLPADVARAEQHLWQ